MSASFSGEGKVRPLSHWQRADLVIPKSSATAFRGSLRASRHPRNRRAKWRRMLNCFLASGMTISQVGICAGLEWRRKAVSSHRSPKRKRRELQARASTEGPRSPCAKHKTGSRAQRARLRVLASHKENSRFSVEAICALTQKSI